MDTNNTKDVFKLYRLSQNSLAPNLSVEWFFSDPARVRRDSRKMYNYLKNVQGKAQQQ